MNLYHQADMKNWIGRTDARENEYYYQIIQPLNLSKLKHEKLTGFALLGFECDLGVRRNQGRAGAAAGPHAIKQALARLPVHHQISIYDAGSIIPVGDDLAATQAALGEAVKKILDIGLFPIVLGGGHETAWGHYQGITKYLTNQAINIVNFDAHFDLRDIPSDNIGTSGTPFWQIALDCEQKKIKFNYHCAGIQLAGNTKSLFEKAKQLGVHYLMADDIYKSGEIIVEEFLSPVLAYKTPIYLSICLDVFAAGFAPGVSAVQPLGISPWHIISAIKQLAASKHVVSLDMVELAPNYDIDQRTAKLAAQLLNIFIHNKL